MLVRIPVRRTVEVRRTGISQRTISSAGRRAEELITWTVLKRRV